MKRVKEKNMVIGELYWMDKSKVDLLYYVGMHDGYHYFYPKTETAYSAEEDGTVPFLSFPYCYEYEEVE